MTLDSCFRAMEDSRLDPPSLTAMQERKAEIHARLEQLAADLAIIDEERGELTDELAELGGQHEWRVALL